MLKGRLSAQNIKYNIANTNKVVFEVTDNCNMSCEYCAYGDFYNSYDPRKNINMDFAYAKNMLQYLFELWNSDFNISVNKEIRISFYGGEPLTNFNLIEQIVGFINQQKLRKNTIQYGMTTNALLLYKYSDFLVKNKFQLLISIDGNKFNNSYRILKNGKESFDKVMNNITSFMHKYPTYFNENVQFNSVLHNKNSISTVHNFIYSNFAKIPHFSEINLHGVKKNQKNNISKVYKSLMLDYLNGKNNNLSNGIIFQNPNNLELHKIIRGFTDYIYDNYNQLLNPNNKNSFVPTSTCRPLFKSIFLTVNGKVLPCEAIGHINALGKVTRKHVIINFNEIANNLNKYFDNLVKLCDNCYDSLTCHTCIFELENKNTKKIKCNNFKNKEKLHEYLSFYFSIIEEKPEEFKKIIEGLITI